MELVTIPKACGFEAATRFATILLRGSLIPIVFIGMGMALTWPNTYGQNPKHESCYVVMLLEK